MIPFDHPPNQIDQVDSDNCLLIAHCSTNIAACSLLHKHSRLLILGMIPFDHSANQIDQVDSKIKDMG